MTFNSVVAGGDMFTKLEIEDPTHRGDFILSFDYLGITSSDYTSSGGAIGYSIDS